MPYINIVETRLQEAGILPEIKKVDKSDALALADALAKGGLSVVEIALRSEDDAEVIRSIRNHRPDMLVGAGNVENEEQAFLAAKMGAHYISTPSLQADFVKAIQKSGMLVFPGCSTEADFAAAVELRVKAVKFFPSQENGGAELLAKIAKLYPDLHVIVSGGKCKENLGVYPKMSNVLACGCHCMNKCLDAAGDKWLAVQNKAEELIKVLQK